MQIIPQCLFFKGRIYPVEAESVPINGIYCMFCDRFNVYFVSGRQQECLLLQTGYIAADLTSVLYNPGAGNDTEKKRSACSIRAVYFSFSNKPVNSFTPSEAPF